MAVAFIKILFQHFLKKPT